VECALQLQVTVRDQSLGLVDGRKVLAVLAVLFGDEGVVVIAGARETRRD
jgi:hypothetical protein